jgi:NTE family protein
MHSGYLAQAMLASSAFPTLFSPVEIDGRLLIDGGVSNNYPVEEIRKMGADIIIGVDVQDDLKGPKCTQRCHSNFSSDFQSPK